VPPPAATANARDGSGPPLAVEVPGENEHDSNEKAEVSKAYSGDLAAGCRLVVKTVSGVTFGRKSVHFGCLLVYTRIQPWARPMEIV
jgi:hypothetical protein